MVSFTAADHARVATGEITVTWRLWKHPHVRAGRAYSTGFGWIEVEDVRAVRIADIAERDALDACLPDRAALIELARSHTGATVSDETLLYRVQFRYLPQPPPETRPRLSPAEVAARLDRLDRVSRHGPWTLETLRLIEARPRTVARLLATAVERPILDFKADVRKLKALGLTSSLEVGYELTELGQTYLDGLAETEP